MSVTSKMSNIQNLPSAELTSWRTSVGFQNMLIVCILPFLGSLDPIRFQQDFELQYEGLNFKKIQMLQFSLW